MSTNSHTISNFLHGNYLLTNQKENQLLCIEYNSQFYQTLFNFLNFQIFNHLKQSKPLLIIDLDNDFHPQHLQCNDILKGIKVKEIQDSYTIYENNILYTQQLENVEDIIKKQNTFPYLEILIRGIELKKEQIIQSIKQILIIEQLNIQVTVLIPQELDKNLQKTLNKISNCRIIINQLIESKEKLIINEQDYRLYDILVTMVLKKSNGHSFLKQYLIDGHELWKYRLKLQKYKVVQQIQEVNEKDIINKLGATFNLQTSSNQKEMRQQLDNQINPYKQIMTQDNAPLIYQNEGDEQRIIIDDDDEKDIDFEEVEEYEG